MVEFRPHRLRIRSTTGHRDDATGDWIADTESWSDPIPCRYVANGTGQQIKLDDGTFYTFSYVVYLDPDDRIYRHGDMVRRYDKAGNLQSEQPITRPHKGQLDTKLWL